MFNSIEVDVFFISIIYSCIASSITLAHLLSYFIRGCPNDFLVSCGFLRIKSLLFPLVQLSMKKEQNINNIIINNNNNNNINNDNQFFHGFSLLE